VDALKLHNPRDCLAAGRGESVFFFLWRGKENLLRLAAIEIAVKNYISFQMFALSCE
jgi:hypothetical protein